MIVETEACTSCVDGWVGDDPRFEREDLCHVCGGDTVLPVQVEPDLTVVGEDTP